MSKKQLIRQLELITTDLSISVARALKYYTAYDELMNHFNKLPRDIRIELDKKLKQAGL